MNINLKKALDILNEREYKKIVIEIRPSDREMLKSVIKAYILINGEFSRQWEINLNSKDVLDKINYLFFSLNTEKKNALTMRRQSGAYTPHSSEVFFNAGEFFIYEKGKKKKLDL